MVKRIELKGRFYFVLLRVKAKLTDRTVFTEQGAAHVPQHLTRQAAVNRLTGEPALRITR